VDEELPALGGRVTLSPATIEEFRTKGHTVVRSLCTPDEVAAWRVVLEEATRRGAWDTRPLAERDTYGRAFLQAANLWRLDPRIETFTCSERLAAVAADLLGVEHVRLYHDQGLLEEVGGGRTPWHQDQQYWPLEHERPVHTLTMWMPLVDVDSGSGSLRFASGSHLHGDLAGELAGPISDESDATFESLLTHGGFPVESHDPLRAGDATFHAGWTLHSAGENASAADRPVATVIWFADGCRVTAAPTRHQRFDLAVWLDGADPGGPAAGPSNPRLPR
jgi:ectoine hydroxylase-related dioxygenase (phytanoyl-CoA dioxygenase family)